MSETTHDLTQRAEQVAQWNPEAAPVIRDLSAALVQAEQREATAEQSLKARTVLLDHMRCMTCGTASYQPNERCKRHISAHDALQTEVEMHNAWRKRAEEAEQREAAAEAQLVRAEQEKAAALESDHYANRVAMLAMRHRDAAESRLFTYEATVNAVIDVLDKHTRALHFQRTTPENLAALIDAICETDKRNVQQKQTSEAIIRQVVADLRTIAKDDSGLASAVVNTILRQAADTLQAAILPDETMA